MSASHHDHPVTENKPVSFTVPFILAVVTLFILFAFLSLCDPSHHDSHGSAKSHDSHATGHQAPAAGHGASHGH